MIVKNTNEEFVKEVEDAIAQNDGHCPCAIYKTEDTKCMCKDFRDKLKNPEFTGYCTCELYKKEAE